MAAAQAGDRVAYETLLRECVSFIAGVARRQGVRRDGIDDVVQEVLLTVDRARATYDPRRSFDAWLRVIAEKQHEKGHDVEGQRVEVADAVRMRRGRFS
jgi:RNA polymerase sigma-70 factor (ECF subfamily)